MATLTSSLNTAFTPAAGDFIVQCSAGTASLERRNTSGAGWVRVGEITGNNAFIVSNPVAGAQYQFVAVGSGTPTVQADQ
ncbi:hypothetical protein WG922_21535 [Ramlibacter sp. AN1015]|uniref:hypothetical protein n=1 Tax=Ramlibacter sp. AN1015 TaxID=3133428 RepID=UPI0030C084A7